MLHSLYTLSFSNTSIPFQQALPFPGPEPAPGISLAELFRAYLDSRRARGVSPGYLHTRELMAGRLARLHSGAAVLSPGQVEALLLRCAAKPVTQNNYLRLLRMAFKWGRRHGHLPATATGPEIVETRIEPPGETALYAADELVRVLAALSPQAAAVAALVAFCGVRVAEALRLAWLHVDFERGFVTVPAARAKTRARRLAPLTPAGAAWLHHVKGTADVSLSLWSGSRMSFAKQLASAHVRAGVKARRNGLRHSFISYRLAAVGNEHQVALEAGNSPAVIFRAYRELVTTEQARAWFDARPGPELACAA